MPLRISDNEFQIALWHESIAVRSVREPDRQPGRYMNSATFGGMLNETLFPSNSIYGCSEVLSNHNDGIILCPADNL